jgi:hypothetical protein
MINDQLGSGRILTGRIVVAFRKYFQRICMIEGGRGEGLMGQLFALKFAINIF